MFAWPIESAGNSIGSSWVASSSSSSCGAIETIVASVGRGRVDVPVLGSYQKQSITSIRWKALDLTSSQWGASTRVVSTFKSICGAIL